MDVLLPFKDEFCLSNLQPSDAKAQVKYLNDPRVRGTTENIPYPYTFKNARQWSDRHANPPQNPTVLVIRNAQAELIGSVGLSEIEAKNPYVAELGYWLAPQYWRRGIMTEAVRVFIGYSFDKLGLMRLWTRVFEFNEASRRVLEKNGFQLEGILKRHIYRDGQFFDDYLYGLLKVESE